VRSERLAWLSDVSRAAAASPVRTMGPNDPEILTPVPRLIVEYRQLTKLVNTYLVALKEAINPKTDRVHASWFNFHKVLLF
jgi:hypothetical protein